MATAKDAKREEKGRHVLSIEIQLSDGTTHLYMRDQTGYLVPVGGKGPKGVVEGLMGINITGDHTPAGGKHVSYRELLFGSTTPDEHTPLGRLAGGLKQLENSNQSKAKPVAYIIKDKNCGYVPSEP